MDLFVCWANVWRSQVAEWFAKNLWKDVISCASVEARKEKYNYKPEKTVTEIMDNEYNIDISNQVVYYPSDIKRYLNELDNIYFLFNLENVKKIDTDVLIYWKTLWKYLDQIGKKYFIFDIEDPDNKDLSKIKEIVKEINYLINWTIYN